LDAKEAPITGPLLAMSEDRAEGSFMLRVANVPVSPAVGKSAIVSVSEFGSGAALLGSGISQSSGGTAERTSKVAVIGTVPLQPASGGNQYPAFRASDADSGGDATPGPYAMLFVGISLVAFMAIRRMGHA
jgi:hypothetical protein